MTTLDAEKIAHGIIQGYIGPDHKVTEMGASSARLFRRYWRLIKRAGKTARPLRLVDNLTVNKIQFRGRSLRRARPTGAMLLVGRNMAESRFAALCSVRQVSYPTEFASLHSRFFQSLPSKLRIPVIAGPKFMLKKSRCE